MKIRKFEGEDPTFLEYDDEPCAWCTAGRDVRWSGVGLIFFENDAGEVRIVECIERIGEVIVVACRPSSPADARAALEWADWDDEETARDVEPWKDDDDEN
ncbi:MAG TPA: hypothetical protein VF420_13270 [Casimicrobiaceae bacterium]